LNTAGIALAFASAVANAFAVALQAAEARSSPPGESARFRLLLTLARRPRWLLGTGLVVAAWPLQVLALTLAPITVVQPMLASFQLVLLVLARVTLHERVGHLEVLGATAIVLGVTLVVAAAPRHTIRHPPALRLALPLALIGAAALLAYGAARLRPRSGLLLVIGAGLGYAWVDFANKQLANETSQRHWALAALCVIAVLGLGSLAFLQENSALQQRPAVTVAPVIGAVQDTLPVLMALGTGIEVWSSSAPKILALAAGLGLAAAGAAMLGRSEAVARVSGSH
jgi:drug/metabolite transporter (DMT)-like permease